MKRFAYVCGGLVLGIGLTAFVLLSAKQAVAQSNLSRLGEIVSIPAEPSSPLERAEITNGQGTPRELRVIMELTRPDGSTMIIEEEETAQLAVTVERDDRLPVRHPDAWGTLQRQDGNLFVVETGSGFHSLMAYETVGHDAEFRIQVGPETVIYQDVTDFDPPAGTQGPAAWSVGQTLDQLAVGDQVALGMTVLAWGRWQGEFLQADVVLFHQG